MEEKALIQEPVKGEQAIGALEKVVQDAQQNLRQEWIGSKQNVPDRNLQNQEDFFRNPLPPINSPEAIAPLRPEHLLAPPQQSAWITGADNISLSAAGLLLSRRSAALSAPMFGAVGGISAYRDGRNLLNANTGMEQGKYGLALAADATILAGAGVTLARAFGGSKFGVPGLAISVAGIGLRAAVDLIEKK